MKIFNNRRFSDRHGFTMVEVVVVMGIVGMLIAVVNQNLFRSVTRITLSTQVEGVVGDLRQLQGKAMAGQTGAGAAYVDYSVRFETNRYILYPGSVYDSANDANIVVTLEPTLQFSVIDVPDQSLSFARLSGDVRNWNANDSSVVLQDLQTSDQKTIEINQRGIIAVY